MASSDNWNESGSGLSQLEKARKRPPRPPPQPPLPSQNSTVQRKMPALEERSASPPPPENTGLSGFGERPAKPPPTPPWQSQNSCESPETVSVDTALPPSPAEKTEKTEQSFAERAENAVSSFGKPPAKPPHVQRESSQNSTGPEETSSVVPLVHVETSPLVIGPLEPSGPSNGPLVETETPGPSIKIVKCRPVNNFGKVKVVKYFIH